jgi:hypothetical protein
MQISGSALTVVFIGKSAMMNSLQCGKARANCSETGH